MRLEKRSDSLNAMVWFADDLKVYFEIDLLPTLKIY